MSRTRFKAKENGQEITVVFLNGCHQSMSQSCQNLIFDKLDKLQDTPSATHKIKQVALKNSTLICTMENNSLFTIELKPAPQPAKKSPTLFPLPDIYYLDENTTADPLPIADENTDFFNIFKP